VIRRDEQNRVWEVAHPVGIVAGIVPSTNPTSTAIFKSLIAVKARNAIVFSPHPSAAKCTAEAARIMQEAAERAGAPNSNIVQLDIIIILLSKLKLLLQSSRFHCKKIGYCRFFRDVLIYPYKRHKPSYLDNLLIYRILESGSCLFLFYVSQFAQILKLYINNNIF
jgi:hypothetical protein